MHSTRLSEIPYLALGAAAFNAISHTAARICTFLTYALTLHFTLGIGYVCLANKPRYFDAMSDKSWLLFRYLPIYPLTGALAKGMARA